MKIIVVGATGTIGSAIVKALSGKYEVIPVTKNHEGIRVDISDPGSVKKMFEAIGRVDAVISAAGNGIFKPLSGMTDEDFDFCLKNKLMGQVNLVRYGVDHLNDNGSFTLISGVLGRKPTPGSSGFSIVNGGLEAFVRAAALEMPRGIRINIISPGWISETLQKMGQDPKAGTPADTVAKGYIELLEGAVTGKTLEM